ncbi:hypothetical protein F5Y18DRAFT_237144 [Xylariaceae sp. FL1019]|nr:hypothetical protein F5Y18DRAFT_237144 [Xylariaceae sp. FL1019]
MSLIPAAESPQSPQPATTAQVPKVAAEDATAGNGASSLDIPTDDKQQPADSIVSARPDTTSNSPCEDGEASEDGEAPPVAAAPPLPSEPVPDSEPAAADDGWEYHWDATNQAYYFHNRFTNQSTWENPRLQPAAKATADTNAQLETPPATAVPPLNERPPAGGYNPAIHGDYDPNAWYAKQDTEDQETDIPVMDPATAYAAVGTFNRFTGRWQGADQNPDNHNDEAKSRRQMNSFFDVDAAANAHDGRSLKAERSGKKPSKSELKQFKEKRRARKEEKRRAWLLD